MEVNIFLIRFYLKAWFRCPIPMEAPYQDLNFLQMMVELSQTDSKLSEKIIEKLRSHMWYLSEETVGLAFFDKNVEVDVKRKMVKRLNAESQILEKEKDATIHNSIVSADTIFKTFSPKDLSDFVTKKTLNFFKRFKLLTNFLNTDPSQWPQLKEYSTMMVFFLLVNVYLKSL